MGLIFVSVYSVVSYRIHFFTNLRIKPRDRIHLLTGHKTLKRFLLPTSYQRFFGTHIQCVVHRRPLLPLPFAPEATED
jgi:hypothetical protein